MSGIFFVYLNLFIENIWKTDWGKKSHTSITVHVYSDMDFPSPSNSYIIYNKY